MRRDTDTKVTKALNSKIQEWKQVLAIIISVCGIVSGVILWATSSHAAIKDWTTGQDFVTKEELKEVMKEQYVPKHEFATVKQKLDDHHKNHQSLMRTLDKMDKKLDKLERRSIRER